MMDSFTKVGGRRRSCVSLLYFKHGLCEWSLISFSDHTCSLTWTDSPLQVQQNKPPLLLFWVSFASENVLLVPIFAA